MKAENLVDLVKTIDPFKRYGKVIRVVGLMIESRGPESSVGDVCLIHVGKKASGSSRTIMAEVVGFKEEKIILMPYTNLQEIGPGSLVEATSRPLEIKVGHELIGKVVDSLGNPLDDSIITKGSCHGCYRAYPS